MTRVFSFPPVSDKNAKALILGSMPGAASLAAHQYYAHPRNHFWAIMGEIAGAKPSLSYEARLEILKKRRIALWDVLKCCRRPGSLDAKITGETANDFAAFFARHPGITHVYFNGTKAESAFKKLVAEKFAAPSPDISGVKFTRLPFTSPANASWSFERKLDAWRGILL